MEHYYYYLIVFHNIPPIYVFHFIVINTDYIIVQILHFIVTVFPYNSNVIYDVRFRCGVEK